MKKYNVILIFLSCLILLSSCNSLSKLSINDPTLVSLDKENYKGLNGSYFNIPSNFKSTLTRVPHSFQSDNHGLFNLAAFFKFAPERDGTDELRIEFLNPRKAKISLVKNDKIIEYATIRGKLKKGYFYSRQRFVIVPFFPLFFGYKFNRFRIGKTETGLQFDFKEKQWAIAFITGVITKGQFSAGYEKINK